MRFFTFAKLSSQAFQEWRGARYFGTAGLQAFKLDEKATARLRRQPLQKVTNPIDLIHDTRFRST